MSIEEFLNGVNRVILNPLITLIFAVAFLIFFYGIFQFIASETSDTKRSEGKKKIVYGLVGMFIMFSAYGLVNLVLGTFNIDHPEYIDRR